MEGAAAGQGPTAVHGRAMTRLFRGACPRDPAAQCKDNLCKNEGSGDTTCCETVDHLCKQLPGSPVACKAGGAAKADACCKTDGEFVLDLLCEYYDETNEHKEKCLGWKKKVEGAEYNTFFLACAILVLLLEVAGAWYLVSQESLEWRNVLLVMVVGVRSFDMMSDWYVRVRACKSSAPLPFFFL